MKITEINPDQLTSGMRQYYDVKIDNLDKIVLFQLGDFYELFFEDAIEVAQLLELTLTQKSAGLKEKIPMAGVPLSTLDATVKRLMKFNKQVAIVEQDMEASVGKKLVVRRLKKIVTPGTFQDTTTKDNNYIVTIAQGETVALAYGDMATGEMYNVELVNLEEAFNYILSIGAKEVVDPKNLLAEYDELASSYNITLNHRFELELEETKAIEQANKYLIEYLRFVSCDQIAHLQAFETIVLNNYVTMSLQTQKQLELVETLKDGEYVGSLYHYLNKTNTAMGRRLLKRMIIQPLLNENEINKRHQTVQLMIDNTFITEELTDSLSKIYDFERLIGRLSEGQINPKEMEQLKKSINHIPGFKASLYKFNNPITDQIADQIDDLRDIAQILNERLIDEPPMLLKEGNIIRPGFNEKVDELRDIKNNSNKWLAKFEIQEREKTGIKTLKVKYNKIFGYFIEVTNSFLNLVPETYIRKQTMANCERYITDELKVAENEILNAADRLNELEFSLYAQLKEDLKQHIPRLQSVAHKVAYIDVMTGFTKVSMDNHLVCPEFTTDNRVEVIDAWHPIVKLAMPNFIQNDIIMDESEAIMLITGPNMAGKSTYMRQFVLTVIMAQIGCYVPAKKATLKLFDRIYTRIGASDDLANGKSTFMVEMSETADALNNATENSLLIFDELGRGTSTYDGVALASSIIEYIHEKLNVKTLFSTHYHELVDLEETYSGIKNVHVKAKKEDGKLKFYHKISEGGVEKSYGIEVAKLANLPEEVTTRASEIIGELEENHSQGTVVKQTEHKPVVTKEPLKVSEATTVSTGEKEQFTLFDIPEPKKATKEVISTKEKKILNEIKQVNISNMTPLEAMMLLNDLQSKL